MGAWALTAGALALASSVVIVRACSFPVADALLAWMYE